MSAKQPTIEILKAFLDAFNRHDLDAIMDFFYEDCIFDMPRGPEFRGRRFTGKKEVRDGLATRFSGLPDAHYGNDRHFVSGNRGCSEWFLTGTRPDGERIEVQGCDLFEFKGDKIFHKDSYWKLVEK